jgi:hypothetical protein
MFLVSEEIEFILDFKLNNVDTIFYCFVFFVSVLRGEHIETCYKCPCFTLSLYSCFLFCRLQR